MPHYVQAPAGAPTQKAHGLILATLITATKAAQAIAEIRALVPPPSVSIETISHFENPNQPPGNPRQPGDRIAVFVNSTDDITTDAAHVAMDALEQQIANLPAGAPPNQPYFNQTEHY